MLDTDRKVEIERRSHALRQEIFDHRLDFWDRTPQGLEVADPEIAALVLGVKFQYHESLDAPLPGITTRTAGILDRKKGTILVALRFGLEVARFTAAHEVGHWIYHEVDRSLHRDLPIKGLEEPATDPVEREANFFAACFLMPRKYVIDQFQARFPSDGPLRVDNAVVAHLGIYDRDALLYPQQNSLMRERIFARAGSYAARTFVPLAELFKVSVETMAIRIRELGLIRA